MFRYLNEEAETLSRAQITELQNKRLKEIVAHTAKNSPWSAARYKAAGVDPANFRGLADLHKLPFCSKKDFYIRKDFTGNQESFHRKANQDQAYPQ